MQRIVRLIGYAVNGKRLPVALLIMFLTVLALAAPSSDGTTSLSSAPKVAIAQQVASPVPACPDLVKKAVQSVNSSCANTGRNKVCYGNTNLSAETQAGAGDVKFSSPGDITDLKNIKTIKLSALNDQTGDWGVALMRLQANLPDTAPGQNVTVVMFGDVEMTDASQASTDLKATSVLSTRTAFAPTIDAANTMLAPTQIAANTMLAASQQAQQTRQFATLNARATNADATQLARATNSDATALFKAENKDATAQIAAASQSPALQAQATIQVATLAARATSVDATALAKGTNQDATAYVKATNQLMTRDARATKQQSDQIAQQTKSYETLSAPLPVPIYRSMQAFYFRTGVGDTACAEAPHDGILVQSPGGKQTVTLSVDEAIIELGSTVYMTAQPGGKLSIYTLEGSAGVTSFNQTEVALAGMVVRVPIDNNLKVSGPPEKPVAYAMPDLNGLPLSNLPKAIQPSAPRDYTGTGSLVSGSLGEACVTGGVSGGGATDGRDIKTVAVPVGGEWNAKAGTTATFKVTGSLLVQGVWRNYIALAPVGAGLAGPVEASAFAVSGGSTELTYTFTKDIPRFYVDVGVTVPGSVSLTVSCTTPATSGIQPLVPSPVSATDTPPATVTQVK